MDELILDELVSDKSSLDTLLLDEFSENRFGFVHEDGEAQFASIAGISRAACTFMHDEERSAERAGLIRMGWALALTSLIKVTKERLR